MENHPQSQSSPGYNPTEIWWPHPSAIDDLVVDWISEEDGSATIQLSAPDDTECADWLNYFNETEERKAAFGREFIRALLDQIKLENNGKSKGIPDEQSGDHPRGEEDRAGTVEEH